jgi:hypothetical protein
MFGRGQGSLCLMRTWDGEDTRVVRDQAINEYVQILLITGSEHCTPRSSVAKFNFNHIIDGNIRITTSCCKSACTSEFNLGRSSGQCFEEVPSQPDLLCIDCVVGTRPRFTWGRNILGA